MSARAVLIGPRFPTTAAATVIAKVPDRCSRTVDCCSSPRTSAHPLPARGLHPAALPSPVGAAQQKSPLRDLVSYQCGNPARCGSRSAAPRRGDRVFSVLHTWNQKLQLHPHLHIIIPAGGLSPDPTRWVPSQENYFLPKAVLRKVFRGKFVAAVRLAFRDGQLRFSEKLKLLSQPKIFAAWLRPLFRLDWVVYLKRPFGGPAYVLHYLGRYTYRVAISNSRQCLPVFPRWRQRRVHCGD